MKKLGGLLKGMGGLHRWIEWFYIFKFEENKFGDKLKVKLFSKHKKNMKTKVTFQGLGSLILMATILILLTNCKKTEESTTTSDHPTGTWSGTQRANDPSIGHWLNYTLTVDFDKLTARSTLCGEGQIVGIVKTTSASIIEIDWPMCGYETVSFSLTSNILTASGSVKAYSDNRVSPTEWNLTK